MTPEEEYRLVRTAHQGDRAALRELEAYLFPTVRRVATRILISHPASISAKDLIQEGFVTLFDQGWKLLLEFQPDRGPLQAWVAFLLTRSFVSYLRGGARTGRLEKGQEPEKLIFLAEKKAPVENNMEARDELRRILAELHQILSPEVWLVFVLVFVEDLSIPEVMSRTKLSRETIDGRIHRARKAARTIRDRMNQEVRLKLVDGATALAGGEDE